MTARTIAISRGLGCGPPPRGWVQLVEQPLVVLVGVTGVGKSTTLAALGRHLPRISVLPDRRTLTDRLIIASLQQEDGEAVQPVLDRARRFDYSRRYRERHPGGMAHALGRLVVDPGEWPRPLFFDGLRGVDEVAHATRHLPRARFVVLDAPDAVRIARLLSRRDGFDRIAVGAAGVFDWGDVPEAAEILSARERERFEEQIARQEVDPQDLRAKLTIVAVERRNYDPAATLAALQRLAPDRTLHVDTTAMTPEEAAQRIARELC